MTLWAVNPGYPKVLADMDREAFASMQPRRTVKQKRQDMLQQLQRLQAEEKRQQIKRRRKVAKKRKRNPGKRRASPAQLRNQKRFAAAARARAKAARSTTTRTKRRKPAMAKRRRKATRKRTGTMVSVRRGGRPVARSAWRASGYRRNRPKKRRRYGRNPETTARLFSAKGLMGAGMDLVKGSGAALAGAAAGKFVTGMIPFGDSLNPLLNFAKGAGVAIGIRVLGEKVVGRELARFAAVGAMIGPLKELIVAYAPGAASYLGDGPMYFPRPIHGRVLSSYSGAGSYADGEVDQTAGMGSYSGEVYQQ